MLRLLFYAIIYIYYYIAIIFAFVEHQSMLSVPSR